MSTPTPSPSGFFTRAVTAVAILGPIVLVIIASRLPDGMRGDLIVNGHIYIVGSLSTALALRAVYGMGFSHARRLLASSLNRSLTE